MHWPLLPLAWLLATSALAIPIQPKNSPELVALAETSELPNDLSVPRCSSIDEASGQTENGQPCHKILTDDGLLVPRDIARGWFSTSEQAMLQREAETNVNFFNLLDALSNLANTLDKNRMPWAVAGGLALKIHGQPGRYTSDIDIVIQTTMPELQAALKKDTSYILPGPGWPSNSHLRVYHNQGSTTFPKYIEIDMIIAGTLTTPQDLRSNSVDISKKDQTGRSQTIHVMRLGMIFKSKVYALATEWRHKDDKDMADISWIIEKTPGALKNTPRDVPYDLRQLVILHLERLNSPLIEKARQLLQVSPTAHLHSIPPPVIVGAPTGGKQRPAWVKWLANVLPIRRR